jgi:UTP--glucose-1-phosphate uridylyltransferase
MSTSKTTSTSFAPVRKAVFPVAGLGTRMLPATKTMPKEMLNIVDRPIIQLAVDEARQAGIEHFIFVTGRNKAVIEDHFDHAIELEHTLQRRLKVAEMALLEASMIAAGKSSFVRQQQPLGLGHAVGCAEDLVGDEPFAVILPDMVMKAPKGCLAQMIDVYNKTGGNVIASESAPQDQLHRYGVLDLADNGKAPRIVGMVEKPKQGTAPSDQIVSGRYILQPGIFGKLRETMPGAGGEIQLTDAMISLMAEQPFHALRYEGQTFDCGDRLGFVLANVAYGLDRKDISAELAEHLLAMLAKIAPATRRSAAA